MSVLSDRRVALARTDTPAYAQTPPYRPHRSYPEWPGAPVSTEPNPAFELLRELLAARGFDAAHRDTADWNPLREIVRPGASVVLKPNLVYPWNQGARRYGLTDTDALVTHGSVIRAALDYIGLALGGRGRVLVADCPIQGARWEELLERIGFEQVRRDFHARFPGVALEARDFRLVRAELHGARVVRRVEAPPPPGDYVAVDLGAASLLEPLMRGHFAFGVTQYPRGRMRAAHAPGRNLYLIPRAILEADVLVTLPKMKAHVKAGISCALKNAVGMIGHKDYLPHFRYGSPKRGGDEHPDGGPLWDLMWYCAHREWDLEAGPLKALWYGAEKACQALLRAGGMPRERVTLGGGGWHGNDTLWRTILDVNRALFHCAGGDGRLEPAMAAREHLAILDGVVAAEGEGPLCPTPKRAGLMLLARNPAALDAVAAACMGFDVARIPQVREAFRGGPAPLADFGPGQIEVCGLPGVRSLEDAYALGCRDPFVPSLGFAGAIERLPAGDRRGG